MELQRMAVCRECLMMLRAPKRPRALRITAPIARPWSGGNFTIASRPSPPAARRTSIHSQDLLRPSSASLSITSRRHKSLGDSKLARTHARIAELTNSAITIEDNKLPSEQRVLYVLEQLGAIATGLMEGKSGASPQTVQDGKADGATATSALLGSVNARQSPAFLNKTSLLNFVSTQAEEILRNATVFITPAILKSYVQLQIELQQPASFPDIFTLYATKPTPKLGSDGHLTLRPVRPGKANAAIDDKIANAALQCAITAHNMPLSVDIIDTTFGTLSFRKSKALRKALLPFGGLLLSPFAAWAIAKEMASGQNTMSEAEYRGYAFAGFMTYVWAVSTLGYVAITTSNDQMDRVAFARGIPLWERWAREEERAALDIVAGAWGFKDVRWRGLEEGAEWEDLKENIGRRGMWLDAVHLMENME